MQSREETVKKRQQEREARLAKQLRSNLKRRKSQAKSRVSEQEKDQDDKK